MATLGLSDLGPSRRAAVWDRVYARGTASIQCARLVASKATTSTELSLSSSRGPGPPHLPRTLVRRVEWPVGRSQSAQRHQLGTVRGRCCRPQAGVRDRVGGRLLRPGCATGLASALARGRRKITGNGRHYAESPESRGWSGTAPSTTALLGAHRLPHRGSGVQFSDKLVTKHSSRWRAL